MSLEYEPHTLLQGGVEFLSAEAPGSLDVVIAGDVAPWVSTLTQFKNNHFTEMCCGTSYLRLIDSCITQIKAQGPSGTVNESKEEEEGF